MDYTDSALIHRSVVEDLNAQITVTALVSLFLTVTRSVIGKRYRQGLKTGYIDRFDLRHVSGQCLGVYYALK